MSSQSQIHICGRKTHVGKKLLHFLRRSLSRTPPPPSLPCASCAEIQLREKRMSDFVAQSQSQEMLSPLKARRWSQESKERLQIPETRRSSKCQSENVEWSSGGRSAISNLTIGAQCAPPARVTNQTLMAHFLGDDQSSIQALKNIQQSSTKQKVSTKTDRTTEDQERELADTTREIKRIEVFWSEIHADHEGYPGPNTCKLCKQYRNKMMRSRILKSDNGEFEAEIDFAAGKSGSASGGRDVDNVAMAQQAKFLQEKIDKKQKKAVSEAMLSHPRGENVHGCLAEVLEDASDHSETEDSDQVECEKWQVISEQNLRAPHIASPSCSKTSLRLWRPTSPAHPTNLETAIKRHTNFVAGEQPSRNMTPRSYQDFPSIPSHKSLWAPPPPSRPALLSTSRLDGSLALGRIRQYLSLPSNFTPTQVFRSHVFLFLGGYLNSAWIPKPLNDGTILSPGIKPIFRHPRAPGPRAREHLWLRASDASLRTRAEVLKCAESIEVPELESLAEVEEFVYEGVEMRRGPVSEPRERGAPKRRLEIIRSEPSTAEVKMYRSEKGRKHKVPQMQLSPLRNETVVMKLVWSEEEDEWLAMREE